MSYLIVKYSITAFLVVLISEIAKRNDKLGALVGSLPLVTILTLIWLYTENAEGQKIRNHAYYTFWYVIPSLPLFLVFPKLHSLYGFWPALGISILMTFFLYYAFSLALMRFGIDLF